MAADDVLVEFHITVMRNGDVVNDTVCGGSSFADVYRGMHLIRDEVDRIIRDRRLCPFNPKTGDDGASLGPDTPRPRCAVWPDLECTGPNLCWTRCHRAPAEGMKPLKRDPTEAMLDAVWRTHPSVIVYEDPESGQELDCVDLPAVWRAMWDAG
jgi:hypothetical protein